MTLDTQAARQVQLLVVDPKGHLLLKRDESLDHWTPLGSALAHDEDYPAAAIRLLYADVGLVCPLGPLLRQRRQTDSAGQPFEERFFLVRCPDTQPTPHRSLQGTRLLAHGGGTAPRFAWWSLAQMQSAEKETFSPSWLPELLASVLFSEMMMPTSTARL